MMRKALFSLFLFVLVQFVIGQGTDITKLTIQEAIEIAQKQSPDIIVARHSFRSSYWNYTYYKANYLPSLAFTSRPNFNHRINVINMPDGTSEYVEQNQLITDGAFSITQNVP